MTRGFTHRAGRTASRGKGGFAVGPWPLLSGEKAVAGKCKCSEYIAQTDMERCMHCGDCIDLCLFDARLWDGDRVTYDPSACYGCGLCVNVCPAEATTMQRREA